MPRVSTRQRVFALLRLPHSNAVPESTAPAAAALNSAAAMKDWSQSVTSLLGTRVSASVLVNASRSQPEDPIALSRHVRHASRLPASFILAARVWMSVPICVSSFAQPPLARMATGGLPKRF